MSNVPAFQLEPITDGTTESLWLLFQPNAMEFRQRSRRYLVGTKNLVETFFMIEQEHLFGDNDDENIQNDVIEPAVPEPVDNDNDVIMDLNESDSDDESDSNELPVKIIDDLYLQLRDAHREQPFPDNYTDGYIQHKDLRPKLTNYQINGVKWMLNRELRTDYFPTEFKGVLLRWPDTESNTKFFYNDRTIVLLVNKNDDVAIPTGGILADAMGLGKTVEMLDLILLNRRNLSVTQPNQLEASHGQNEDQSEPTLCCLCPEKKLTDTVQCTRCFMFQHRTCVSQRDTPVTPDAQYKCPTCWQTEEPLEAKTTFIVSPTSIKLQWRDEVIKHIGDENFKVSNLSID